MLRREDDFCEEQDIAMQQGTEEVKKLLISGDTNTAIIKTKEMFKELATQNVCEENVIIHKLRIILGICLRIQYSV